MNNMRKVHDKLVLKVEATDHDLSEYRFSIEFYVFQEGEDYIAYCPSLDISSSGNDFNDAVANFYECFRTHVEWCVEHGTLIDDLIEHGWKKKKDTIMPPSFTAMLKKKEVRDLLGGRKAYEKVIVPAKVSMPA